jgi:ABC-type glycerol-3-phosphate transport system substrate-binding protein
MSGDAVTTDPEGASRRSLLAATASATVGVTSVAGCLGRAEREGTVVMTGNTDMADAMHTDDGRSIHEALRAAGLDEDITVEVRAGVNDSTQRMREAQSALQAGRAPPDIFRMDSGWTIPFILREQTVPLADHLPTDLLEAVESEYLDASLETARHPDTGDLHGLPLFVDFGTMLYRRDLVEEAGFDADGWSSEPPTWQRFSEMVAETRDETDVEYGFTTQAAAYEGLACCSFNEVMTTWGGAYFGGTENLFSAGDREVTVDDEPVVDAVRMMRAFIEGGDGEDALEGYRQICPSAIVQWSEIESLGPFADGNAVANRNWPFAIAETGSEAAFGEDLGVMPMPYAVSEAEAEYPGTGGTAAALGGWHLTLNPHSEKLDAATRVLEAFASEEVMLTIFEQLGYLPPALELVESVSVDEVGPVARYTDQIRIAGENAVSRPVTDVWPEQASVIARQVHAAYRGERPPEGALSDLAGRLRRSEAAVADQGGNDRGD